MRTRRRFVGHFTVALRAPDEGHSVLRFDARLSLVLFTAEEDVSSSDCQQKCQQSRLAIATVSVAVEKV